LDTHEATHVIHWTTEGKHYKVDFPTFACLLGLDRKDRCSTTIFDISALAMDEYQLMYLDGYHASEQTVWLKPYYYVLNTFFARSCTPRAVTLLISMMIHMLSLIALAMSSPNSPLAYTFGPRFSMLVRMW